MSSRSIKTADAKGRISLGADFANRSFIVTRDDDGLTLTPAAVIPERELWLHQNPEALKMVQEGLAAARKGKLKRVSDFSKNVKK